MPDHERIAQLLQAALESDRMPDEVCADAPDLLPEVRRRWENCRLLKTELNSLFPSSPGTAVSEGRGGLLRPVADFPDVAGYEIEAVLGRGGMGVVYKARHLKLRRTVAIKMLLFGEYASGVEVARFLQEARTVAALRHPHVVQVFDVGECGGLPFFTMELLEGGSLAERLGGAPQPPARAATLLATLADAVESAHRCGIVHRDLKPSNVLLTAEGLPKISDFGLARQTGAGDDPRLTMSGQQVGTRSYMAPEQASPKWGPVGPAADVYALGAMLYEMLTGRPPFFGHSAAETERQLLSEDPVPPSRLNGRVPRDLETVCLACLRKDPSRRYASAAALAADVGRFQRGEPIAARPTGTPERVVKWVRRRPAAATALAGGLLAIIVLASGGLWLVSQRAATARLVDEDLRDIARFERRSAWAEASASLERAKARLGAGGPLALRARAARGDRDLRLVARINAVRLERASGVAWYIDATHSYQQYVEAFREAGLGTIGDDPTAVAAAIKALDVRPVLVAALDDWAACTTVPVVQRWLMDVAQHADGDPTDWRARARDPKIWGDRAALDALAKVVCDDPTVRELVTTAPGTDGSASLLVTLGERLKAGGQDRAAIPFLERVQRAHPADFWANSALGEALRHEERYADAVRYFQAAVTARPDAAAGHTALGEALAQDYRTDEAMEQFRQATRLNPTWIRPAFDAATALGALGRNEQSVAAFREAVRLIPGPALEKIPMVAAEVAALHYNFALTLKKLGKDAEAIEHFRGAMALNPGNKYPALQLRDLYLAARRMEEAAAVWRKGLSADPAAPHGDWHGYAELCLYLGHADEYRRTRQALLTRFGAAGQSNICERVGRACLLFPGSDEERGRATAMVDRAVATTHPGSGPPRPHFLFAKGLAEYRAGRFESAVSYMNGEASSVLVPGPQLVKAMALQRLGRTQEAMGVLVSAVDVFDWSSSRAGSADDWMFHILRREAERMLLPNLDAFLAGTYQPHDLYERMAMAATCQSLNRYVARARLWSDVLAAEPRWADDAYQYAVGAAALAGSGIGSDAGTLTDADRTQWRDRARGWIRDELAAADATLKKGDPSKRRLLLDTLTKWTTSYELAGVRDKAGLEKLPPAERADWLALWLQVDALLKRVRDMK